MAVDLEKRGHIGIITMNRPEALNALNGDMLDALDGVISQVEADEDIFVCVLTGAGRSFVAGADIGVMSTFGSVDGKTFSEYGNNVFLRLENMKKPVIAAINGFAFGGGCELAMSCDIRVASEKAKFSQPEVGLGIIPGFGGTQRMARICGISNAMRMILTADTIGAAEAKAMGLVSEVYAPEELIDKAVEMAEKIASKAQVAIRQGKRSIRMGLQTDIRTGVAFEAEAFGICCNTVDQKGAMAAFVNKEKYEFVNK